MKINNALFERLNLINDAEQFNNIFMSSSSSSAQSTNSSPPSIRSVENEMEEVLFSAPLIEFEHEEIVENTMVEWDDVSDLMNIDPVAMVEQANSDLNQIIVEINAQQVVENIITREIDGKQCTIAADKMLNMNDDETNIINEVSLQNVTNAIIVDNNMQDTTNAIAGDRVNGINEVDIIQHTNIMNGGMQHADDIYFSPGNANQHWEIQRDDKFLTEAEQRTSLEEFEGNYPSRGVYRVSVIQKAPQTNGATFGPDDVTNISSDGMIMTEGEEMCSDESWNDYTLTCLSTLENNLANPILLGETGQTESNNDDESIVLHYSETSSVAVLQPVTEHNTIEDNIAYNCSHCNEKVVSFKKLSNHLQQHSINDWLLTTCNNDKQNHLVNSTNNNNNTITANNNDSGNKNNNDNDDDDDKSREDDDDDNKDNNNGDDKKNNVILILSEEQRLNGGCQINLISQKSQCNRIEPGNGNNVSVANGNKNIGKTPTGVDDERELNEKIESYVQQQYHSSAIAVDNVAATAARGAAKQQKDDKAPMKAEVPRPITMEMSVHNEQADTRDVSVYVKSEIEPESSISREHRISLSIQTVPKTTIVTAPTVTSSSLPATNTSKIVTVPKDLILPDGTLDISKLAESTREFLLNRNFYRCSPPYKPMMPVAQQDQLYGSNSNGGGSNAAQNYPTLVEILTSGTAATGSGTNVPSSVTPTQTRDESDERTDSRYSQSALECAHCNVSFFNKTDLLNHLSTHFIFQCPQCFERFANKQNLDHHVSKNKCNLRCKVMKVVTSTKNSEVLYECNYCHSQFIGMKDLNEHLKTHAILIFEKPPPSTVTLPPISSFADVTKSVSITIVTTNDATTNSVADAATTTIYSAAGNTDSGCTETTKITPCLSIISGANVSPSRKRWRKTEPPPIPFVCTRCDRVFNRKQDLKNHERHHFSPERYYRCSFCSITLKSKEDLEGHIKQHAQTVDTMAKNNRYPFRCVNCEQLTFSSLDQLTSHLDTHLPKGVYECAECCLRFRHKEMFKSHMRGHVLRDNARIESTSVLSTSKDKKAMKDWGVRCNFCSAVFTSQAERNRHTKTHENDENTISRNLADPSNCIYCNGKLETISDIIHHIRLHTDERKQFPCSICDRKIIAERNENTEPGNAYYCNYCIQKMNEYRQPPPKSNNGTIRTTASTIKSVSSSRSVKKKIIAP